MENLIDLEWSIKETSNKPPKKKYPELDIIKADCLTESALLWRQYSGLVRTANKKSFDERNLSNFDVTPEMSCWFQNCCGPKVLEKIKKKGHKYKSAVLEQKKKIASAKAEEILFV
ncbi:MAG: hypothetical protein ACRCZ9_10150 [Fusobacteriaceae bacterium]